MNLNTVWIGQPMRFTQFPGYSKPSGIWSVAPARKSGLQPCQPLRSLASEAAGLGLALTQLSPNFGARISGLDLTKPLNQEQTDFVLAAFDKYDGLLFRDQKLTPADEERLLLLFPHDAKAIAGQRWENFFFDLRPPANPLIAVRPTNIELIDHFGITSDKYGKKATGIKPFVTCHLYHQDRNESLYMPYVSSMYMVVTPETGGDTLFAHSPSFLESLPAEELQYLESLKVSSLRQILPFKMASAPPDVNYGGTIRIDDVDGMVAKAKAEGTFKEPTWNPLVIRDRRTGKKSLVLSPFTVYTFQGMSPQDSRLFAKELSERCCSPDRIYRHKWEPNDFFVWANRRVIHSSTPTQEFAGQPRLYHLVFLNSDDPVQAAQEC